LKIQRFFIKVPVKIPFDGSRKFEPMHYYEMEKRCQGFLFWTISFL
jgi:hypothetical protein